MRFTLLKSQPLKRASLLPWKMGSMSKLSHPTFDSAMGTATLTVLLGLMSPAIAEEGGIAQVVSNKPDMVTGEEVLVELRGVSVPSSVSVLIDGRNVDGKVRAGKSGDKTIVHVGGLKVGSNRLEFYDYDSILAKVDIIDHPITGPVFSGSHQQPFVCQTEAAGLGA